MTVHPDCPFLVKMENEKRVVAGSAELDCNKPILRIIGRTFTFWYADLEAIYFVLDPRAAILPHVFKYILVTIANAIFGGAST